MTGSAAPVSCLARWSGRAWLLLLLATLLVIVVAPLSAMLIHAVIDRDRSFTLAHFSTVVQQSVYWQALANTILLAGGAALVATSLGTAFGWIFARTDTPARGWLERVCEVPIFIPPFVGAVAWALIAAPRTGLLNRALQLIGLPGDVNVYSLTGMLVVIGLYLTPYVMLIVAAALRSMDPSLEEAAQISGLSPTRIARMITLPLLAPAVASGLVIAFTIAIGLFGTPIVLGWSRQIHVLTTRIWIASQEVPPHYGVMAVLSIYLLALSVLALALQRLAVGGRSYVTVTGKGFRPRLVELGGWRWLAATLCALYVVATILAPVLVLLVAALSTYTWSGQLALSNMINALTSDDVWFTMRNSVVISLVAATVGTVLGIAVSWLAIRTRMPGRAVIEHLMMLPISVPGIAFGVGVLLVWINVPLAVYGTSLIIVLAFAGRFTAYAVRAISSSLTQIHPELEESARVSGYGALATFLRITLPLILPSVVASWVLLFSFFITELSMVVLLYTSETRTFSVLSFEVWNVGEFSRLASLSLLQLAIGLGISLTLRLLTGAKGTQHG